MNLRNFRNEARDDYLEAILLITLEKGHCRSINIAEALNVTKPSVSVAVGKLVEDGLITLDDEKMIHFTPEGRELAELTLDKHNYLKSILVEAGIDADVAGGIHAGDQDVERLLWLIGTEIDKSTEVIYHIHTDEPEKLPENRVQYGFDNRGFRVGAERAENELEPIDLYRVFERKIPDEYNVTAIVVGFNTDGTITWSDSFRVR